MSHQDFPTFFKAATGNAPYDYRAARKNVTQPVPAVRTVTSTSASAKNHTTIIQ